MTISIPFFLLLTVILSTDTFMAGLSYSSSKVHVPLISMLFLALVSGFMYTLSLFCGNLLSALISVTYLNYFSFIVLFLLAIYKLYDTFPSHSSEIKEFTTDSISGKVNTRHKQILSPAESVLLAVLLSADSISAGLSTGLPALHPAFILIFTGCIQFCAFYTGYLSGRFFADRCSYPLNRLSAFLLFILALLRLF